MFSHLQANAYDTASSMDEKTWLSPPSLMNTLISGTFTKARIREAAGRIFEAFPQGIRFTIHAMTAEGERVAVEAESRGMHVSGKLYNNFYHFLFQFRDGQLVRVSGQFRGRNLYGDLPARSQLDRDDWVVRATDVA